MKFMNALLIFGLIICGHRSVADEPPKPPFPWLFGPDNNPNGLTPLYGGFGFGGFGMFNPPPTEPTVWNQDGLQVPIYRPTRATSPEWINHGDALHQKWEVPDKDTGKTETVEVIRDPVTKYVEKSDSFVAQTLDVDAADGKIQKHHVVNQIVWNKTKGYSVACLSATNVTDPKKQHRVGDYCYTVTPALCQELRKLSLDRGESGLAMGVKVDVAACARVSKKLNEALLANNKSLDLENVKAGFADFEHNSAKKQFKEHVNSTLKLVEEGSKDTRAEEFGRLLNACESSPQIQMLKAKPNYGPLELPPVRGHVSHEL